LHGLLVLSLLVLSLLVLSLLLLLLGRCNVLRLVLRLVVTLGILSGTVLVRRSLTLTLALTLTPWAGVSIPWLVLVVTGLVLSRLLMLVGPSVLLGSGWWPRDGLRRVVNIQCLVNDCGDRLNFGTEFLLNLVQVESEKVSLGYRQW
jgi:hypothetical protein